MIVPAKLQHRAKRAQQYLHQLLNWIDQLWYNGCKMKMIGRGRAGTCCCIGSPFIGKNSLWMEWFNCNQVLYIVYRQRSNAYPNRTYCVSNQVITHLFFTISN